MQMDSAIRDNAQVGRHKLTLVSRRECELSGVTDAISFDENAVILETVDGMVEIKGHDMHVSNLNLEKGEVAIEGRADSIVYTEKTSFAKKGEGLLTRLFS